MKKILLLAVFCSLLFAKDPLNSPMWEDVKNDLLGDSKFVFDDINIKIKVPSFADNPLQVPIYVDASFFKNAKKLYLFADLNAIVPIAKIELKGLKPIISLNMKIAQGTPLRAAVLDEKGLWHVGSAEIKSFGGGCSVASEASGLDNWEDQLGKSRSKVFNKGDTDRVKFSFFHPMDTGLFVGNPQFFVNKITIKDDKKVIATMETFASISENPRIFLETKSGSGEYDITLNDTDGNEFLINTSKDTL